MSSEIRNDVICNSNPDIMEYLIEKLESRKKNLSKYANIINSIDSFESFYEKRKDIYLLFQNLEEELHQASLAIKALVVQNKALSQEISNTKNIQKNYNKLLQENNYLLIENNNFAQELKELKNKKIKNGSAHKVRNPSFNNFSTAKFNNFNDIGNNYQPLNRVTSTKKINNSNIKKKIKKKNDNYKKKNADDIYNFDLELNEIDKLKNVKNIMKNIQNNKNKLKEAIEQHFAQNGIQ